jgi:class 3 adenylate cyclase
VGSNDYGSSSSGSRAAHRTIAPDGEVVVEEPERARPRAEHALTFLFTDLEASTRLWEEYGAAMSEALAQHDALARTAIADNGGRIVKTTGDGTHAVFTNAEHAVRAACDAQRALAAATWGATGPLRVRIAPTGRFRTCVTCVMCSAANASTRAPRRAPRCATRNSSRGWPSGSTR